jgi:exodeoxyribonuclease V gamma subunit
MKTPCRKPRRSINRTWSGGYCACCADWLDAWANGDDVLITARGETRPLEDHQRWQPALWRILREDVAATQGDAGLNSNRAQVHRRFLKATEQLDGQTYPPGLPRRLIIFGISSLPQQPRNPAG